MAQVALAGTMFIGSCAECDGAEVSGLLLGDATSVRVEGQAVALDGGLGLGECGHMTMIIGGSSTVMAEGKAVAYSGCQVVDSIDGQIIGGAGTVFVAE